VITIYTGTDCRGCDQAKRLFTDYGVQYQEVKVSWDEVGNGSLPQVEWPWGEWSMGFQPQDYRRKLRQMGG